MGTNRRVCYSSRLGRSSTGYAPQRRVLAHERDERGMGARALARDAAGGMGGAGSEMRWPSVLFDLAELAVVIVMWTVVLWLVRQRRLRVAVDPSPRRIRGYRLHTAASISVAVGVTWFIAWFVSDANGPQWLHSLSLPAALVFIAGGAILAGYAARSTRTSTSAMLDVLHACDIFVP